MQGKQTTFGDTLQELTHSISLIPVGVIVFQLDFHTKSGLRGLTRLAVTITVVYPWVL